MIARYLIDTSAAARMHLPYVAERLAPLIETGVVATIAALDAEALYTARGPREYEQIWADRRVAYDYVPTEDDDWANALAAQRTLARTGRHRAIGMPDLLTAVLAGRHRLTVVHYDADFEIAAEVIDFRHRWVSSAGTL